MTPDELPDGWRLVDFGSLVKDSQNGFGKRSGQGRPTVVLRLADVSIGGRIATDGLRSVGLSDSERAAYALRSGDLLAFRVNGSRSIVGRVISYTGPEGYAYCDHFIRFRLDERVIYSRFAALAFQVPGVRGEIEARMVSSAGQNTVSQASFREISLPLPPLDQQMRIVEKVDALLVDVNAACTHLTRVREILKRFRQSVLAAAASGRLTEDWRAAVADQGTPAMQILQQLRAIHKPFGTGQKGNAAKPSEEAHDLDPSDLPATWAIAELMWLCHPQRPITYGILKPGPHHSDGVPYVRVADFPNDQLRLSGIRRTTRMIADAYRRSMLRTGDVLLSIRGTYGRLCRVPSGLDGANITQDTARLGLHELINPDYVVMFLKAPATQDRMRRAARGVAVRGLNIGDVRALQLALPPRKEANEIVRRVETLLAVADRIEVHAAGAVKRSEGLPQSILSRAFRGQLAPAQAEQGR